MRPPGFPGSLSAAALITAAACLAGATGLAAGGEPLVADRPTFAPSTVTAERGRLVVELGASGGREDEVRLRSFGEALLRFGVYESIELRLGGGSWIVSRDPSGRSDGVSDPSVGLKVELFDYSYRLRPESALVVETSIPAGSRSVGGRAGWQPRAGLVLAWELGDRMGLGAFAGAIRARSSGERFTRRFAAVSVSRAIGDRTSVFAEWRVVDGETPDAGAATHLLAGWALAAGEDLQLDAWGQQRLDGHGPRWQLGAGVTWRPAAGRLPRGRTQRGSGRMTSSRSSVISRYAQSGPSRPVPDRLTPP